MEVARHAGRLRTPAKDGSTEGAHLRALAARGNAKALALLAGPAVPVGLAYLWEKFRELDAVRRVGEHGPEPLTWQDIAAWAQLTDQQLAPHEVRALLQLDGAILFPASGPVS